VIGEVNAALRALLTPLLPEGAAVRFGPPVAAGGPGPEDPPVLGMFLAEIREDTRAVAADWTDVRDPEGNLIGRRPPIRRFDLHYLVTGAGREEEKLLDAVLGVAMPGRRLPSSVLTGDLVDAGPGAPVYLQLSEDAAAVYRRSGLPPRTAVGLVVSAPLILPIDTELAPPAERMALDMGDSSRGAGAGLPASGNGAARAGTGAPADPAGREARRWPRRRAEEPSERSTEET
jgi:hypothetical protein